MVLNDTRVIKARLAGRKASGEKIELFVERVLGTHDATALIRASHAPALGAELYVDDIAVRVDAREGEMYRVRFSAPIDTVLERFGAVPLPPYIRHAAQAKDAERYQTVYAATPGAVAAPTAGCTSRTHAQRDRSARAAVLRITLHVGFGTFQPVRVHAVEAHRMHSERYAIPRSSGTLSRKTRPGRRHCDAARARGRGGRRRARRRDRSLHLSRLRVQDGEAPAPNFHLPKSTPSCSSAFAGVDNIRRAYAHAIAERYRFFSYGDAMLIEA